MLSWLVCRNGLHKHDFWEIIKSKIRHSNKKHTYLRHIGFARWFQGIESLFGGNWANGPFVRDKCPCQFSHGRACSTSMYGEWWGETCQHWHVCVSLCVSGTMLRQSQGPRRLPREHAECFLSIVGHTNAEQRYHQWGKLTHFYHTIVRRSPPTLFRQLHVVRFPCGREKNMGTYGYTKWTCSQSLTVLERTISDLQA